MYGCPSQAALFVLDEPHSYLLGSVIYFDKYTWGISLDLPLSALNTCAPFLCSSQTACPSCCLDYWYSILKASAKENVLIYFRYAWATAALNFSACVTGHCGWHTHTLYFYIIFSFSVLLSWIEAPVGLSVLHLVIPVRLSTDISFS